MGRDVMGIVSTSGMDHGGGGVQDRFMAHSLG